MSRTHMNKLDKTELSNLQAIPYNESGQNVPTVSGGGFSTLTQTVEESNLSQMTNQINEANSYFLTNAVEAKRDGIVSSRPFGVVYLIRQTLEKMKSLDNDLLNKADRSTVEFVASLIALLLSKSTSLDSTLDNAQNHLHFPFYPELTPANIRTVLQILSPNLTDNDTMPETEESAEIMRRLTTWINSDKGQWHDTVNLDGINILVNLALQIKMDSEKESGRSWEFLSDKLDSLHIIQIEFENKTVWMTTRTTSKQLSIFYSLSMQPPPLIIDTNVLNARFQIKNDLIDDSELEELRHEPLH